MKLESEVNVEDLRKTADEQYSGRDPHFQMGVIKIMLQTQGVNISPKILPANANKTGLYLVLWDDLLKIDVPVYARLSKSGYSIQSRRSVIEIFGRRLVIEFERPYQSLNSDIAGIPFRSLCNIEYDGHLALTANHGCVYFSRGNACKFCAIPAWRDSADRSLRRLTEAVACAITKGDVKHMSLTCGSSSGPDRGIKSILLLLRRIREHVSVNIPVFAEFEAPLDIEWIVRLHEMGVETVSCNIEFLTQIQRNRYLPGKSTIPFDRFMSAWRQSVALFGRNQVFSNVLMLSDEQKIVDQLASSELDMMMDAGAIPSPGPLYPDTDTSMQDVKLPSMDEQIYFVSTIADRLRRAKLDPRHALAGCQRNGAYSTLNQFIASAIHSEQRSNATFGM